MSIFPNVVTSVCLFPLREKLDERGKKEALDRFVPLGRGRERVATTAIPVHACCMGASRRERRGAGRTTRLHETDVDGDPVHACIPLLRAGAGAGRPASCCWWTRGGAREDRRPSRVVVVPCLPRNQRPGTVLQGDKHASTTLSDFSACQDWWPGCSLDAGHSALLAR